MTLSQSQGTKDVLLLTHAMAFTLPLQISKPKACHHRHQNNNEGNLNSLYKTVQSYDLPVITTTSMHPHTNVLLNFLPN